MSVTTTNPLDAFAKFENNEEVKYIDVRTVAEFVSGHPRGPVVNVPYIFHHPQNDDEYPNDSFLLVVEDNYAKDDALIIGDDVGDRANRAAEALTDAGYSNVSVMLGGMQQWQQCDLPITGDNRDGVSYVSLLTPAKRRKPEN